MASMTSTGAGAQDISIDTGSRRGPAVELSASSLPLTRRHPEVEEVNGEFLFITESRRPSKASITTPSTTKDSGVILHDDYWTNLRVQWDSPIAEEGEGNYSESSTAVSSTSILAHRPNSSPTLPSSPRTAHLQDRFRDGPFESLFPGSTEFYEIRRSRYISNNARGFSQDSSRSNSPVPPYGPKLEGIRVIEDPENPGWYATVEPKTLARSLFFLGFLFFPFWILNIFIMMITLRPTSEWEESRKADGLTEDERAEYVAWVRQIELKWARRSVLALMSTAAGWTMVAIILKYSILRIPE